MRGPPVVAPRGRRRRPRAAGRSGAPGGAGSRVLAHAQLVASSPASGAVLPESPDELRLVFSEPLEAEVTSLDLAALDGTPDPRACRRGRPRRSVCARRRRTRSGRRDLHDRPGAASRRRTGTSPRASSTSASATWREACRSSSGHGHGDTDVIGVIGRWLTYLGLLAALGLADLPVAGPARGTDAATAGAADRRRPGAGRDRDPGDRAWPRGSRRERAPRTSSRAGPGCSSWPGPASPRWAP